LLATPAGVMASAPKKSRVGNDSELKPIRAGGSRAISPRSNVSEAWNETNVNVTVDGQTADGKRTTTKLDVERNPSAENQQKSKLYGWLLKVWRTTHTLDKLQTDRELVIKTTLRELIIYLVFLIVICIVTYGMASNITYYYTRAMKNLFVDVELQEGSEDTFESISSMDDFWTYTEGPLLNGLYWEKWYNQENVSQDEFGYLYYENKLLGRPRLRLLRVRSDSCRIHDKFEGEITNCYDDYSSGVENTSNFGLNNNKSAWTYQSSDELDSRQYWGRLATYSGGGFTQLLPQTRKQAEAKIAELKENLWLDRASRVVFIDFTVYNANINLFCVVKLIVEFPATGGAITSAVLRSVKLLRYVSAWDYFVMACELIFCLFIIYYIIEEVLEIHLHRLKYFMNVWNCLDIIMILIAIVSIIFSIYRTATVGDTLQELLDNPDQYANFESLGFWQMQYNYMVAVLLFFAWFKLFKYISFNKTMGQLSSTLSKCAKDIVGFCIMFFIVFFAYAQLGYLVFGSQLRDFSTFGDSVFTLFRIILGDFDFVALEDANRVLGPIFFVTYVFFVFFVLLVSLLPIITTASIYGYMPAVYIPLV
jgi:hypothetical protein